MKLLLDDLNALKKKGIFIKHIRLESGPTLAEEASQVNAEIQLKTVSSISLFQKILIAIGGFLTLYLILATALTILFIINPLPVSDFFGYYYRFNANEETGNVLAAAIGPGDIAYQTSILADVIKPAAVTSLVAVKAIDDQKYVQIVTNPVPGPAGVDGKNGANGIDGKDGLTGPVGPTGPTGPTGSSGISAFLENTGSSGTYGSSTQIPVFTTDSQGRITAATNTNISGFLTTEADTLNSVVARGFSTSINLVLDGGITTSAIYSGTGKVQIEHSGTTTPNLFVLDNGTNDPTGVNGGAYYNTSTNKSRCYQNGIWTNCINGDRQLVGKTTDQSVTSSTTLTDDSALTFTVGSNETWIFNYFLFVTNNSSAQPDFKATILGASGWTCSVQMSGAEANGSAFPQAVSTDCDDIPTALVNSGIGADNNRGINVRIQGIITTTSAGSVVLQFAQNTSSANPVTIKAGSYVQAFKAGGV